MTTFTQKVLAIEPRSKGKNKWNMLKLQDVKGGKIYDHHLIQHDKQVVDDILSGGPGIYELDKEKEGDYWKIKGARKTGNLAAGEGSSSAPASNGNGAPPAQAQAATPKSGAQLKTEIACQALSTSGKLIEAMLLSGMLKEGSPDKVMDLVEIGADKLRKDAVEFVATPAGQPSREAEGA